MAAKMPDEFAVLFRAPAGHRHIAAHAIIAAIESAIRTGEPNEWSARINLQLPDELANDIGREKHFPLIVESALKLRQKHFVIDGEVVVRRLKLRRAGLAQA
jgi:hypothetical protein